jgi:hypothetical protein
VKGCFDEGGVRQGVGRSEIRGRGSSDRERVGYWWRRKRRRPRPRRDQGSKRWRKLGDVREGKHLRSKFGKDLEDLQSGDLAVAAWENNRTHLDVSTALHPSTSHPCPWASRSIRRVGNGPLVEVLYQPSIPVPILPFLRQIHRLEHLFELASSHQRPYNVSLARSHNGSVPVYEGGRSARLSRVRRRERTRSLLLLMMMRG